MPRTTTDSRGTTSRSRRRIARATGRGGLVIAQISQILTANESLQRENRELRADNERLKSELSDIGDALGRLTGPPRGRRGRVSGVAAAAVPQRAQRRPITDPEVLERRRQALAKARAARAEKLAAARAGRSGSAE